MGPDDGIVIYEQHNPTRPIVRAIPFVEGREVKINAPFPNTTRGRDAAENLREGVLKRDVSGVQGDPTIVPVWRALNIESHAEGCWTRGQPCLYR